MRGIQVIPHPWLPGGSYLLMTLVGVRVDAGVLNSQNPNRLNMGLIEEDTNTLEQETDAYLADEPDDEIEEFDEDEESRNDGQADISEDNVKGYNLRIDPPRRSANRFTPSVFKKAAKKCKNLVKDVKWAMRK
ncbi:uncharacterized protein LOC110275351 [Arachis duranensis]|uniref:Uncharacterized protein LOC110275351 n=1 Tax=Arachis duranensis TaxID=130453 RepID=A0A6P5MNL9_ARADU|nr:uncharacterized protein LOC110275351 [Arachis duranensis]